MSFKNKAFFLKIYIIYFKNTIIDKWNILVGCANKSKLFSGYLREVILIFKKV